MALRRLGNLGWGRFCPVCHSHFRAFGSDPRTGRTGAACPVCDSRERHRLIWPFLTSETLLGRAEARVLHVAPEYCFERLLRRMPLVDYVTMDLKREYAMVQGDLTKMDFEDGEFDLVICNHVLEHVPDDGAAMREMHRVLSPGGQAVITVPTRPGVDHTLEDPEVRDPEDRLREYGHREHVRYYGVDLVDRLRGSGFSARLVEYGRELSDAEKTRTGVGSFYPIFFCEKNAR